MPDHAQLGSSGGGLALFAAAALQSLSINGCHAMSTSSYGGGLRVSGEGTMCSVADLESRLLLRATGPLTTVS